jgi:glycosyltransferase involved in cell wall biosynthesis
MRTAQGPKALFLVTTDPVGGVGRVVVTLARGLRERGWHTQTLFPQSSVTEEARAWCRAQGVDIEAHPAVPHILSPHRWRDLPRLVRLVRASRADVVNLHYGGGHISLKDVLAVRLSGVRRCVASVHHPVPWHVAGERKRRMTRLAGMLCHVVVANSRATAEVLRQAGVPEHKICLIPCGVPQPRNRPSRVEARQRLGVPTSAFVVSTLALLVRDKGIGDLIEAMARVPDPGGDSRLVVGGDGPARCELERLAASRLPGRATFLGRVPDTADVYAAADVFALPSYLEGFGLVYIEAALHGVPSIGATVGAVPETIRDGETGLLVPPGDVDALANAITRLRDNPDLCRQLGAAARTRALARFTDAAMIEAYLHALRPRRERRGHRSSAALSSGPMETTADR